MLTVLRSWKLNPTSVGDGPLGNDETTRVELLWLNPGCTYHVMIHLNIRKISLQLALRDDTIVIIQEGKGGGRKSRGRWIPPPTKLHYGKQFGKKPFGDINRRTGPLALTCCSAPPWVLSSKKAITKWINKSERRKGWVRGPHLILAYAPPKSWTKINFFL